MPLKCSSKISCRKAPRKLLGSYYFIKLKSLSDYFIVFLAEKKHVPQLYPGIVPAVWRGGVRYLENYYEYGPLLLLYLYVAAVHIQQNHLFNRVTCKAL